MDTAIHLLDEATINKIAAGEVIENPASVIKELVDNSLDAGSSEITVEITAGGRQLIRVTDDGCGMARDDALLSLERHATSKIRALDDITELGTMGFRGEAIPSIASISKFTLLTATEEEGTLVVVDGGRILKHCEAARGRGTTIEVKSLFFNVPVRKKFQRSTASDTTEIHTTLGKLALAHPEVSFHLISNQKTLLKTRAGPLGERIAAVMGADYFSGLKSIETSDGAMTLKGYIGLPSFTRHNRTGQVLILNQRPVQCPLVSYAVLDGYSTRLQPRRHPVYVLHLGLPPDWIDVNVHPQKREVRLRQSSIIRSFLTKAVGDLWAPAPVVPRTQTPFSSPSPWRPLDIEMPEVKTTPIEETPSLLPQQPPGHVLAVVDDYIVLDREGLVLIDRKGAEARVRYEHFLARLEEQESTPIEVQPLLLPVTLNLSTLEASALREHLGDLNALGLDIQDFGQDNFAVNGIPSFLKEGAIETFVGELVGALHGHSDRKSIEAQRHSRLALAASRAPSSGTFSISQAVALYRQLMQCQHPDECPDGHPIVLTLSRERIASLLARKESCRSD